MAFRRPLWYDDGKLREMSDTRINDIRSRVAYVYSTNPSVTLSVVSSGGNLGNITDTRMQAGASITRVDRYATEAELGEPGIVTVNNAKVTQTVATVSEPADTNNKAYPVYNNGGSIKAMTRQDMYDTFILPALETMSSGSTTTEQGGTYRVHTSTTLSGHTAVSSTSIFTDTKANLDAYTAGGIAETRDQPINNNTDFYLLKINGSDTALTRVPMYIRSDNDSLQTYTASAFDTLLQNLVRYAAANYGGYRIRYSWTTGTNRGSGITDYRYNGTGNRQTRFVNSNDYRAQEFPNGTLVTAQTHYLKIYRA